MAKVIDINGIWKMFRLYPERSNMLKEAFINLFRRGDKYNDFWALRDVSFFVQKGEAVGIIGRNGAGKSTIFKLICGVLSPERGEIVVHGRVSPLIELSAGLHPELTGLENIYLNGAIYGLSKEAVDEKSEEIIEFSGLGKFIHVPIRTYSSGMEARLGFSIAVNVDADILLVDEVLAVGDAEFREKCYNKIRQLQQDGITIVYVSHQLKTVVNLCSRVIWLDKGEIQMIGKPKAMVEKYLETV
jgi:ABC-type polysaccharide/polyol phosphate transport system ATPase subunit